MGLLTHHEHHHAAAEPAGLDDVDITTGDTHDETPEAVAIPVRTTEPVETVPYPARALSTAQVAVDSSGPVQLAPYLRNRASLTIVAHGGDVYVGAARHSTTSTGGFLVQDGASLTVETVSELWAICAAGATSTVHVLAQVRQA